MLRNISLRYRLLLGVIGSLIVAFIVMTLLSSGFARNALEEALQQQVQNLVKIKVSEIDGFFKSVGRIPVVLGSASAADEENDEHLLRTRMREVVEKNPDVYGSTISFEPYAFYADQKYFAPYYYRGGPSGAIEYIQFGSDDYVYWEWEWYTGPRDAGTLYWTQPFFDEGAGNIWMVTAAYPVIRDEEFVAVATVDVPIESVKQDLEETRVGQSGYALMVDDNGGVIAASGIDGLVEGSSVQDWVAGVASPALLPLMDDVLAGREGVQVLDDPLEDAGQMWAIYTSVPSTQWHVVTFVSADEMLAPVQRVTFLMGGVSLVGLLVLAVLVLLISNTITRPINTLRTESLAIAEGDLSRRAPVEGHDEISALGQAFNQMADELAALLANLEQRVAERTAKLRAAAEVSRTTTSLLDPGKLLDEVVALVRERFDLYYVGLFLIDDAEEQAVLRAGTGDAGREMLAREHKLAVGGSSMIGQCVSRAEARIALDVGAEAARFDNPFLPETRSEMALPLRSRGRVIGAMTVQSVEEAAFDETDISVMQTMADQVATAIDNARLYAQAQAALQEMEVAQSRYRGEAWHTYLQASAVSGYAQTEMGVAPLDDDVMPPVRQAMTTRQAVVAKEDGASDVAVPILFTRQDQPIGALGFKDVENVRELSREDIALVEALSEQFALAAENLRLLDETQRRAAQERLTREITDKMRRATDMDALIRTTIEEMSAVLGTSSTFLQLVSPVEPEQEEEA